MIKFICENYQQSEDGLVCPICLSEYEWNRMVYLICHAGASGKCEDYTESHNRRHIFHQECITQHTHIKTVCPLDREDIDTLDEIYAISVIPYPIKKLAEEVGFSELFYLDSDVMIAYEKIDDLNILDKNGDTILISAIQAESVKTVTKLINLGVDVLIPSKTDISPLELSIRCQTEAIMIKLLWTPQIHDIITISENRQQITDLMGKYGKSSYLWALYERLMPNLKPKLKIKATQWKPPCMNAVKVIVNECNNQLYNQIYQPRESMTYSIPI
jgi:hypothetical protein